MTSRVTTREIVREEIHDLLHQCFNITESLKEQLVALGLEQQFSDRGAVIYEQLLVLLERMEASEETLRSRVLPVVG